MHLLKIDGYTVLHLPSCFVIEIPRDNFSWAVKCYLKSYPILNVPDPPLQDLTGDVKMFQTSCVSAPPPSFTLLPKPMKGTIKVFLMLYIP